MSNLPLFLLHLRTGEEKKNIRRKTKLRLITFKYLHCNSLCIKCIRVSQIKVLHTYLPNSLTKGPFISLSYIIRNFYQKMQLNLRIGVALILRTLLPEYIGRVLGMRGVGAERHVEKGDCIKSFFGRGS